MATNPKYPLEPNRPQPVNLGTPRQQKSLRLFVIGAAIVVVLVLIFLAVWLLQFGGGSQQEQPKPHQSAPTGVFLPLLR
jgi:cytoskeletal protein RodZ